MNARCRISDFSSIFLRLALGISFLSAVVDRFGLWGAHRQPDVSSGNYERFVIYMARLNWFLPAAMIPVLAIIATAAGTVFGLLLVRGWKAASHRKRMAGMSEGLSIIWKPMYPIEILRVVRKSRR